MRLYEFEAKQLLAQYHLPLLPSLNLHGHFKTPPFSGPYVLKAQVLSGNRAQHGGIQFVSDPQDLPEAFERLRHTLVNHQLPHSVLIEPLVKIKHEFYLALTFSSHDRAPVLLFSDQGGSHIERRPDQVRSFPLSLLQPQLPSLPFPQDLLHHLFQLFTQEDARLVEINPLVLTQDNRWLALDAKIILDEAAHFRHPQRRFPPRSHLGRQPTARELQAHQVSQSDHRGVAGANYLDFGAGVGILASGGGASIVIMDTLLANQLQPANYTEYSGNPPREKVKALTQVVLSHPLNSLLVAGGNANFTDIYQTLMGVMDAVLELSPLPRFPIVIRRGGPRWQEAFTALKQLKSRHHLNLHLFGPDVPITFAVSHLVKLLQQENHHVHP